MLRAHLTRRTLNALATCTALASALLLGGCGGGSRSKPYVPEQMVSFGDENSLIDTYTNASLTENNGTNQGTLKGLIYTVNPMAAVASSYVCPESSVATSYTACDSTVTNASTTQTVDTASVTQWFVSPTSANVITRVVHDTNKGLRQDTAFTWSCNSSTLWIQYIAHAFHLGYANYGGQVGKCPTDSYNNATTHATYGARTTDIVGQINAHLGELGKGTLVTVMAGQWDILDVYTTTRASIASAATADQAAAIQAAAETDLANRATQMADAIISIVGTGAKVVVALTPDLGESPLAYTDGQRALLKALTLAYNNSLYIDNLAKRVSEGGRVVAGVNPEPITDTSSRSSSYSFADTGLICPEVDSNNGSGTTPSTTALYDPLLNRMITSYTSSDYADRFAVVKYCNTSNTTRGDASSTTAFIWADPVHFSPTGHGLIGSSGYTRASNQF